MSEFPLRLAQGDLQLPLDFQLHLRGLIGTAKPDVTESARQTWGELCRAAEEMREVENKAQKAAAAAQRLQELQALAARGPEAWRHVEQLIDAQKASTYDRAVAQLILLRDLAKHENRLPQFQARIDAIKAKQGRCTALVDRMRKAGL